jgi:hypothetical protein
VLLLQMKLCSVKGNIDSLGSSEYKPVDGEGVLRKTIQIEKSPRALLFDYSLVIAKAAA